MPDTGFGSRHRRLGVIVASAASIVVVVAAVALIAHPWRDAAAHSPAGRGTGPATASGSPSTSPAPSLPAAGVSVPAFSAAPSPTVTGGSTISPSATPSVSRHTSPKAPGVTADNQIDFNVSVQVSPTQAVVGQHVRVAVKVVNAGGVFNRPVTMFFQGSDPSDDVGDAPPSCTASGSITCPITGIRAGRQWSFTFTFIPGPFPAAGHFDDAVCGAFDYTDGHGQRQQTPSYCAHVLLVDTPASPPPNAAGTPSNTTLPSLPPASAASTSATPAP